MAVQFGTDGIRGRAFDEITSDLAYRLGRAVASVFTGDVFVGYDTRESSPLLARAVLAGLRDGASQPVGQVARDFVEGSSTNAIRAELHGHDNYLFEYCGALRAFLRPYFLVSFLRESRVRSPAFFRAGRTASSISRSEREMPRRRAPAWPATPPPSMVASMS